MTDQVREHLEEFDELWFRCFKYRGKIRENYQIEFRKQWTRKMDRMLTVYNNYDTAIHKAQMAEQRETTRAMQLQTEVANLTQTVANLREENANLRQNGRPQTEMHWPAGGTGGAQTAPEPNAGPDTGI